MSDQEAIAFLTEMNSKVLFEAGKWIQIGIASLISDRLIGDIGIFLSDDQSNAEIGFTLEPRVQGRGIATAAVREAIDLIFLGTGATQVVAITDTRNARCARLLRRVGFQWQERRNNIFRGESCAEDLYGIRRKEC